MNLIVPGPPTSNEDRWPHPIHNIALYINQRGRKSLHVSAGFGNTALYTFKISSGELNMIPENSH